MAERKKNDVAEDDRLWETVNRAAMVEKRGRTGSRLMAMAEKITQDFNDHGTPIWGTLYGFEQAWKAVGAGERKRIMNGWREQDLVPSFEPHLHWMTHSIIYPVLLTTLSEKNVTIAAEFMPNDGSRGGVAVAIRQGMDLLSVIASLRAMTLALEEQWGAAIELRSGDHIEVAIRPADQEPAEKALEAVQGWLEELKAITGATIGTAASDAARVPQRKPQPASTCAPKQLGGKERKSKAVAVTK